MKSHFTSFSEQFTSRREESWQIELVTWWDILIHHCVVCRDNMTEQVDCKQLLKLITSLQTLTAQQQQVNINKFVSSTKLYQIFTIFNISSRSTLERKQYSWFLLITQSLTIFIFRWSTLLISSSSCWVLSSTSFEYFFSLTKLFLWIKLLTCGITQSRHLQPTFCLFVSLILFVWFHC